MKIAGIILIVIGFIDFGGTWIGFDLWGGFFGVDLPELVWTFTAYAEGAAGYFLMTLESESDVVSVP